MWTRGTDWEDQEEEEKQEETDEGTWDSSFAASVARFGRRRLSTARSAITAPSPTGPPSGPKASYWVRACSRPEHFDPRAGKFVPEDR